MHLIKATSYAALSCIIRLATFTPLPIEVLVVIILPDFVEGIHFSSQILMLLPSPITHLALFLIIGFGSQNISPYTGRIFSHLSIHEGGVHEVFCFKYSMD